FLKLNERRKLLTSGGFGTMGFGLPAAMGAKIGAPDRTVCLFVGDGGLQMTIQELGTIMAYNIGVKIILLNNDYLGNVRQWQELFFNSRFSQTPLVNPDFNKIAEAYGIRTGKVTRREDLADAIADMLSDDKAYLLNAAIGSDEMIFPMIAAGTSYEKIMISKNENYFPLK
ncbi:MAG: acetolactate synthase large subunit, partial [Muribaculaceae bacterium]|nr:acetolactate synthase large subunit [Muribaculaceae bacterium]